MRRPRMMPGRPGGAKPVQFFTYGPLEFNVTRALKLAADARKYQPEPRRPLSEWVPPGIDIHYDAVEQSDLSEPVLFATIIMEGQPWKLLIDGNHRVIKALRQQTFVQAITLDLEDTLRVLRGPVAMIQQMKQVGHRLGLLHAER